jgi:hypothetical protein
MLSAHFKKLTGEFVMSISFLNLSFLALMQRINWLDDYIIFTENEEPTIDEDSIETFRALGDAYFPNHD